MAAAAGLLGGIAAPDAAGTVAIVRRGGGRATRVEINAKPPARGAASVAHAITAGRSASYAEVLRARNQLVPSGETVQMAVPPESAQFVRGADEIEVFADELFEWQHREGNSAPPPQDDDVDVEGFSFSHQL